MLSCFGINTVAKTSIRLCLSDCSNYLRILFLNKDNKPVWVISFQGLNALECAEVVGKLDNVLCVNYCTTF